MIDLQFKLARRGATRLALMMSGALMFTLSTPVFAQDSSFPKALTFKSWREQQVSEAQSQVQRATIRLRQAKSGRSHTKEPTEVPGSGRLKKIGESETVSAAEQDLKRAQDVLVEASQLQFDNYVEVYVSNLRDQPETLQKLTDHLSKEELAEILKYLMRHSASGNGGQTSALDATRNELLVGGVPSSRHANTR